MRWAISVCALALVYGCGCSAAGPDEHDARPTNAASEGLEARGDCFRAEAEVEELLPGASDVLLDAIAAWGGDLEVGDECASVLRLDDKPSRTRDDALAVHRPLVKVDGEWTPAGLGGASEIVLSRPAVLDGRIANVSLDECNDLWDAGHSPPVLLQLILTHEAGHSWGLPESESQADAMFFARRVCTEITPTKAEREAIIR